MGPAVLTCRSSLPGGSYHSMTGFLLLSPKMAVFCKFWQLARDSKLGGTLSLKMAWKSSAMVLKAWKGILTEPPKHLWSLSTKGGNYRCGVELW